MQIVLTDVLTCPRCGPDFGLVVLADRLAERRVVQGSLGCANCREMYPIDQGLADLRFPPGPRPDPRTVDVTAEAEERSPEEALRLAALLGVTGGPGLILLVGSSTRLAAELVGIVPDIGIVAAGPDMAGREDVPGINRIQVESGLPLRSRSVRGVAVAVPDPEAYLAEAVRVLLPGGRIVIEPAPAETGDRLRAMSLNVLLEQDGVVVASATGGG